MKICRENSEITKIESNCHFPNIVAVVMSVYHPERKVSISGLCLRGLYLLLSLIRGQEGIAITINSQLRGIVIDSYDFLKT